MTETLSFAIMFEEKRKEKKMAKELERYQQIERSIITTYRKQLWSPFVLAVKKYCLVEAGDKIAVCISGGNLELTIIITVS